MPIIENRKRCWDKAKLPRLLQYDWHHVNTLQILYSVHIFLKRKAIKVLWFYMYQISWKGDWDQWACTFTINLFIKHYITLQWSPTTTRFCYWYYRFFKTQITDQYLLFNMNTYVTLTFLVRIPQIWLLKNFEPDTVFQVLQATSFAHFWAHRVWALESLSG